MIWKNKNRTFAIKSINMINDDGTTMIRIIPCLDICFTGSISIGVSWLFWGFEFWFGDVNELI